MMRSVSVCVFVACALCARALAQPVSLTGSVEPCIDLREDSIAVGAIGFDGSCAEFADPVTWDFWTFDAEAGQVIDIEVDRQAALFDPALVLYQGDGAVSGGWCAG